MSRTTKNLVTGGLGFLGFHLISKLLEEEEEVLCIDNCCTGKFENVKKWIDNPSFKFIKHDVIEPFKADVDKIWHLACPASPFHYQKNPINTSKTSFLGTYNMLGLAKRINAKILFTSSSEVYGNPQIHPQPESYNGLVNNIGERSCYEEGKRIAESLCYDYKRIYKTNIRIVRIFNTYGPKMSVDDGRVISNFIVQALKNEPITIYGDGLQTRSFCYVDDLIKGLILIMGKNYSKPINLGNPYELSILELAKIIKNKCNSNSEFIFKKLPEDDPKKRSPSIEKASKILNWKPTTSLEKGLEITINYFRKEINLK